MSVAGQLSCCDSSSLAGCSCRSHNMIQKDFMWTEKTSVIRQETTVFIISPIVHATTIVRVYLQHILLSFLAIFEIKCPIFLLPSQSQPRKDYEASNGKSEWMRLKHQIANLDFQKEYLLPLPIISWAMPSILKLPLTLIIAAWIKSTLEIAGADPVTKQYPFLTAASGDSGDLSTAYFLLSKNPSLLEIYQEEATHSVGAGRAWGKKNDKKEATVTTSEEDEWVNERRLNGSINVTTSA